VVEYQKVVTGEELAEKAKNEAIEAVRKETRRDISPKNQRLGQREALAQSAGLLY